MQLFITKVYFMRIKLIAISALLASCSSMSMPRISSLTPHKIEIQQGNLISPEMREKVKVGMSVAMVRSILGTPLVMDPFHARRWDYVYTLETGGKLVDKQRLTLYFEDERLERIDDSRMPLLSAGAVPPVSK
jgi:outer membrane protein assembly factor BamE